MKKKTDWTPIREYVRDCLDELAGYTDGDVGDTDKLVDRVRYTLRGTPYVNTDGKEHRAHPKVIKNVTILVSIFNAPADAIKELLVNGNAKKLIRSFEELHSKAEILASASDFVPVVNKWLQEGVSLEECQLIDLIQPARLKTRSKLIVGGIEDVQSLESIDSLNDQGTLSSNEFCKKIELHIGLGNLKLANDYLEEALAQDDQHAGLWFQKACLLMRLSAVENRKAFMNRLYKVEIADPMSNQEQMYQELEDEAEMKAFDLKSQVFGACIKAMSLLPAKDDWNEQARQWSEKYGNFLDLRRDVIRLIVQEAGAKCMPFSTGRNDHVLARLGRCRKLVPRLCEWEIDETKNSELSKLPIFTVETDQVVLETCDEWRENKLHDRARYDLNMRLLFLNVVRVFEPEQYVGEVSAFVERIKQTHPSETYKFFSRFDGFQERFGEWNMGTVLHDHLDCVLSRNEQRELIRDVYRSYIKVIQNECHEALCSVYDDEIRMTYEAKDLEQVYSLACKAEDEGIYVRDNEKEALRLKRAAQCAALSAKKSGDVVRQEQIQSRFLNDEEMSKRAENYFDTQFDIYDIEYGYAPDFFYEPYPDE